MHKSPNIHTFLQRIFINSEPNNTFNACIKSRDPLKIQKLYENEKKYQRKNIFRF